MTGEELAAAGRLLCGGQHGMVRRLASLLEEDYDSVRHMISGRRPVYARVAEHVAEALANRTAAAVLVTASIDPPPAGLHAEDDRDDACVVAVEAAMDLVAEAAERAGWHPAEILAAAIGWATTRMIEGAGPDAAHEMLRQVIVQLEPES